MSDKRCAIKCMNIVKRYALYKKQIDHLIEVLRPGNKSYHTDFYALNGVNLSVNDGECVGIVGKNGSGKSTLLKILTGVLSPSEGSVEINGRISALLELGAGFNPEYTGYENIYLNGSIMGYSRKEMEEKIPEIVEFADIGDFIQQPVKVYSSGMFVRLAFAVAISVDPEILIIDEALAVGDVFFQLKCYKKIEEFKKLGKTILFVSHDQSSIIKYCDRAILLNDGVVVCEGTPKKVIDEYKQLLSNENAKRNIAESAHEAKKIDADVMWKEHYRLNEKTLEYGDKTARIIDFGIFDMQDRLVTTYQRNETYKVKMKVRFFQSVDNPIYAITFKDITGLEVAGTNTMQESIETGTADAGQLNLITFQAKFPFQNQTYFLSFGCTRFDQKGTLQVLHRLYDVICIQTVGAKITNGVFDLDAKVEVLKVGD